VDQIRLTPVPPLELVIAAKEKVTEESERLDPTFTTFIDELSVKVYLRDDMSPNDAYVYIEAARDEIVMVIVNQAHPHWSQLGNSQDVLNYLRHCTYDGLAEWKATKKASRIDPDTIRQLKDGLLRLTMQMEAHQSGEREPVSDE